MRAAVPRIGAVPGVRPAVPRAGAVPGLNLQPLEAPHSLPWTTTAARC
jgi:hypothetical protein